MCVRVCVLPCEQPGPGAPQQRGLVSLHQQHGTFSQTLKSKDPSVSGVTVGVSRCHSGRVLPGQEYGLLRGTG